MRSRMHKRLTVSNPKVKYLFIAKIFVIVLLYIILYFLLEEVYQRFNNVLQLEKDIETFASKNQETVFEINEITYFSSANAKPNDDIKKDWSIDISQFTDISFFISNPSNQIIKSLEIKDVEFYKTPSVRYTSFFL